MKLNNRVLFVGNGVAMRMGVAKKWKEIIADCAVTHNSSISDDALKNLPFNMQIVAVTNDNVDISMVELCRKLRDLNLKEEQKSFGRRILRLNFDSIITTNYTFELELSVSDNRIYHRRYPKGMKRKESDMTLFGYIPVKIDDAEKQIWHIHGHACAPNSVIMGHYYYGRLLASIQQYIPKMLKRMRASDKYGKPYEIHSWVDSFMRDDVYTVGFGMDLCETDIWWLVCCKKRYFPDSKIYFYVPEWDLPKNDSRRLLMETYGVVIQEIDCSDYKSFYEIILNKFSEFDKR